MPRGIPGSGKAKNTTKRDTKRTVVRKPAATPKVEQIVHEATKTTMFPDIIPIQIRPDHFVYIQGIPHDLTTREATKLANIITGFAE